MEPQGWVIIGTKLDSKQLEKDLNNQKRELQNYEKEAEQLFKQGVKAEEKLQPYEEQLALIQEMTDEMLKQAQTKAEVDNVLDLEKRQVDELKEKYSSELEVLDNINKKLEENAVKQELINTKINETTVGLSKVKNLENINLSINKIGHNLGNIIKKTSRWALGIFGIRSAYMIVRNAINMISQEDEKLATTVDYIKYVLASALKPIIEWIVNAVYKLISIFGGIIKAIFGINIFAKATVNNFKKANSSAGALRKTLAGFDEMNVLNDNGGTGLFSGLMNDFPDLADKVEEMSKKIKESFRFPTRQELEEMTEPYRTFWGDLGDWLDKNVVSYWRILFKDFADYTKPLWQPVADAFKKAYGPLAKYIDEKFITPVKEKFTNWKNDFLSKYAKFLNKIIYFINMVFGVWGVNLEYIDEESALTSDDIAKNFKKSFDDTQKNLDEKMVKPFDNFKKTLQDLTSKTWKIVTNFVVSGKDKLNQQLEPLRQSLASIGIKLPYLAKGGIVNMPSRGVPVGSAIAGERGAEGVIPLTDSQQMALLGEAIGRYVTINATIPVYAYNRQVDRQIKRIQAEDNFAGNR